MQDSEYPAVVTPLVTQHWSMLRRNLVYTAVTRGKRLVVVVGQPKALAIAVKGTQARRRWSKLGEWLSGAHEAGRRPAAEMETESRADEPRHHLWCPLPTPLPRGR